MMSVKSVPFPFGLCRVCHDNATGFHYGLITCEGCKVFFRRNILRHARRKCFKGGDCNITPENRTQCKACRFAVCLKMGMSLQAQRKMGRIPKSEKHRALHADAIVKQNRLNLIKVWDPLNSENTTSDLLQTFSTAETKIFPCTSFQSEINSIDIKNKSLARSETYENYSAFSPIQNKSTEGCLSKETTSVRYNDECYSVGKVLGDFSVNKNVSTVCSGRDSGLKWVEAGPASPHVQVTTTDESNGVTHTNIESIKVIDYKVKTDNSFKDYELDSANVGNEILERNLLQSEHVKNNKDAIDDQYEIRGHVSVRQNMIYEGKPSEIFGKFEAVSDTKELTPNASKRKKSLLQVINAFRQSPEVTFTQYLHDANIQHPSFYNDGHQYYNTEPQCMQEKYFSESKLNTCFGSTRKRSADGGNSIISKKTWDTDSWRFGDGNLNDSVSSCNLNTSTINSHTTFSVLIEPGQPAYASETHSFPKTSIDFVISRPRSNEPYWDEKECSYPQHPSITFQPIHGFGNQNRAIPDGRQYETLKPFVRVNNEDNFETYKKTQMSKTEIYHKMDEGINIAVYGGPSNNDGGTQRTQEYSYKQDYRTNDQRGLTFECLTGLTGLTGLKRKSSDRTGEMFDWLHEFNFLQSTSQENFADITGYPHFDESRYNKTITK